MSRPHTGISTVLTATLCIAFGCDTEPTPEGPDGGEQVAPVAGSCVYTNPFSSAAECKEYRGEDWTSEDAAEDCKAPLLAAPAGDFTAGEACAYDSVLGTCVIDGGDPTEVVLVFPGSDPGDCSSVSVGCTFGGGSFVPSELCEDGGTGGGGGGLATFQPFTEVCVDDPRPGEEGETCAWQAISACAEPGVRYDEVASCDVVLTQRPYAPKEAREGASNDDPRLSDEAWLAEFAWVTEQTEACACICCHSNELAPQGPSDWYIEADPIWTDTLGDAGLAMLAGWIDSTAFGAFDPADNNGFSRDQTGIPTTDVARMKAFLEGELARRGLEESDFADAEPFGGPLYDQLVYEPPACGEGQGIGADGTIRWTGGPARYLYVLAADSMSPGVPPNLDTPEGTRWRVDVAPSDEPIASGVRYGEVPAGATQAFPERDAPAALEPGETVYLVALRDVYQPLTRCLATVPDGE